MRNKELIAILQEQDPEAEIDAIVDDIRKSTKNQPKFKTREDEIAYILGSNNSG